MPFEESYYREELDYLRQLGKLLAREKPHLARFLAEKEGDPDVERLMEAFAFLSGGLRQKLEDEFPEFSHGLINMLWANYLRPVPAMTIIEYKPAASQFSAPAKVCRDELISSGVVRVESSGRKKCWLTIMLKPFRDAILRWRVILGYSLSIFAMCVIPAA